ncbi:hypothetical protein DIPPA_07977 [Diplonema papillatum]|nr:hypothetical protein DIPPA_07977 [Diplonema papillatum]
MAMLRNLPQVQVPPKYSKAFAGLKQKTLYLFEEVVKFNKKWKPEQRVLVIERGVLWTARRSGDVCRRISLRDVSEVYVNDRDGQIAVKIPAYYDLCLQTPRYSEVAAVLAVLFEDRMQEKLRVTRLPPTTQFPVVLQKPANYRLPSEDDWPSNADDGSDYNNAGEDGRDAESAALPASREQSARQSQSLVASARSFSRTSTADPAARLGSAPAVPSLYLTGSARRYSIVLNEDPVPLHPEPADPGTPVAGGSVEAETEAAAQPQPQPPFQQHALASMPVNVVPRYTSAPRVSTLTVSAPVAGGAEAAKRHRRADVSIGSGGRSAVQDGGESPWRARGGVAAGPAYAEVQPARQSTITVHLPRRVAAAPEAPPLPAYAAQPRSDASTPTYKPAAPPASLGSRPSASPASRAADPPQVTPLHMPASPAATRRRPSHGNAYDPTLTAAIPLPSLRVDADLRSGLRAAGAVQLMPSGLAASDCDDDLAAALAKPSPGTFTFQPPAPRARGISGESHGVQPGSAARSQRTAGVPPKSSTAEDAGDTSAHPGCGDPHFERRRRSNDAAALSYEWSRPSCASSDGGGGPDRSEDPRGTSAGHAKFGGAAASRPGTPSAGFQTPQSGPSAVSARGTPPQADLPKATPGRVGTPRLLWASEVGRAAAPVAEDSSSGGQLAQNPYFAVTRTEPQTLRSRPVSRASDGLNCHADEAQLPGRQAAAGRLHSAHEEDQPVPPPQRRFSAATSQAQGYQSQPLAGLGGEGEAGAASAPLMLTLPVELDWYQALGMASMLQLHGAIHADLAAALAGPSPESRPRVKVLGGRPDTSAPGRCALAFHFTGADCAASARRYEDMSAASSVPLPDTMLVLRDLGGLVSRRSSYAASHASSSSASASASHAAAHEQPPNQRRRLSAVSDSSGMPARMPKRQSVDSGVVLHMEHLKSRPDEHAVFPSSATDAGPAPWGQYRSLEANGGIESEQSRGAAYAGVPSTGSAEPSAAFGQRAASPSSSPPSASAGAAAGVREQLSAVDQQSHRLQAFDSRAASNEIDALKHALQRLESQRRGPLSAASAASHADEESGGGVAGDVARLKRAVEDLEESCSDLSRDKRGIAERLRRLRLSVDTKDGVDPTRVAADLHAVRRDIEKTAELQQCFEREKQHLAEEVNTLSLTRSFTALEHRTEQLTLSRDDLAADLVSVKTALADLTSKDRERSTYNVHARREMEAQLSDLKSSISGAVAEGMTKEDKCALHDHMSSLEQDLRRIESQTQEKDIQSEHEKHALEVTLAGLREEVRRLDAEKVAGQGQSDGEQSRLQNEVAALHDRLRELDRAQQEKDAKSEIERRAMERELESLREMMRGRRVTPSEAGSRTFRDASAGSSHAALSKKKDDREARVPRRGSDGAGTAETCRLEAELRAMKQAMLTLSEDQSRQLLMDRDRLEAELLSMRDAIATLLRERQLDRARGADDAACAAARRSRSQAAQAVEAKLDSLQRELHHQCSSSGAAAGDTQTQTQYDAQATHLQLQIADLRRELQLSQESGLEAAAVLAEPDARSLRSWDAGPSRRSSPHRRLESVPPAALRLRGSPCRRPAAAAVPPEVLDTCPEYRNAMLELSKVFVAVTSEAAQRDARLEAAMTEQPAHDDSDKTAQLTALQQTMESLHRETDAMRDEVAAAKTELIRTRERRVQTLLSQQHGGPGEEADGPAIPAVLPRPATPGAAGAHGSQLPGCVVRTPCAPRGLDEYSPEGRQSAPSTVRPPAGGGTAVGAVSPRNQCLEEGERRLQQLQSELEQAQVELEKAAGFAAV